MENHQNQMKFLQIAMKHLPEVQEQLKHSGIELTMETIQPLMSLFTKVMNEAYELGKTEALSEEK
jgi:competence protein ComZ